MIFTVPNSYGSSVREDNPCHEPGGSRKGGRFAAKGACPLSVQGMAHGLFIKTGVRVEPTPDRVQNSKSEWMVMRDGGTGIITDTQPLAILLGVEGNDEVLRTIFQHEAGHMNVGFAKTRLWTRGELRIGGERVSQDYAVEVLAYARGMMEWPAEPVKWSVVRGGLGSHLALDSDFHHQTYKKWAKQTPYAPADVPRVYEDERFPPAFRVFKAQETRRTLDAHIRLLKRFHRQLQQRRAA